jgi:putative endonuclease
MKGYVYILTSQRNGTLYTGVTSNLPRRLFEHQTNLTPGFTSRYGVKTLVWFEEYDLVTDAIARKKTIKNWPRKWKLDLIETMNPDWQDIAISCTAPELVSTTPPHPRGTRRQLSRHRT